MFIDGDSKRQNVTIQRKWIKQKCLHSISYYLQYFFSFTDFAFGWRNVRAGLTRAIWCRSKWSSSLYSLLLSSLIWSSLLLRVAAICIMLLHMWLQVQRLISSSTAVQEGSHEDLWCYLNFYSKEWLRL